MNGIIYVVKNKVNGKHYVGQTIREWPERKIKHERDGKNIIGRAINKYGKESFEWNIIEKDIEDQDVLNMLERLHISRYEASIDDWGYNIQEGGNNSQHHESTKLKISKKLMGKKVSEKTRKLMSINHTDVTGENNPMYGKTHKESSKQKMSNARIGKKVSEETKAKLRKMRGGKKHSTFGLKRGKYKGTSYTVKTQNPWTRVWHTAITYNKTKTSLGYFNDPISGEIVYNIVWDEIYK